MLILIDLRLVRMGCE